MTAVHQFLPTLAPRDAIGGHALRIQEVLRGLGLESEIYAEHVHPEVRRRAHVYRSFKGDNGSASGTWLLYQASTGSKVADWLLARREPLILNYHNLTPVGFFAGWEPAVAAELKLGRKQLVRMAKQTDLVIADSAYNEAEMVELGYRRTTVVPILFDASTFGRTLDEPRLEQLLDAKRGGGVDLLFVGRLAPNKAQHDLVKMLAVYRRVYDPQARLHLVGGVSSHAYVETIRRFASALGLEGAVHLVGSVSAGELTAYYRTADVLVSASEHEGFCVPLLEAMHHRVPIVAYGEAAVPETLDGAGVLLRSKAPATMAAAVHRVVVDASLRERLVAAGLERLADFDLAKSRARFAMAIDGLLREPIDGRPS